MNTRDQIMDDLLNSVAEDMLTNAKRRTLTIPETVSIGFDLNGYLSEDILQLPLTPGARWVDGWSRKRFVDRHMEAKIIPGLNPWHVRKIIDSYGVLADAPPPMQTVYLDDAVIDKIARRMLEIQQGTKR